MPLMPVFQALLGVGFKVDHFGPLEVRQLHPGWLGLQEDLDNLWGCWQSGVHSRCIGMDQLRPAWVPQPEGAATITTEVPLSGTCLLLHVAPHLIRQVCHALIST